MLIPISSTILDLFSGLQVKLWLRFASVKSGATAPPSEQGKSTHGKTSQGNSNLNPEAARRGIGHLNFSDPASAMTVKKCSTDENAQPKEDEALSDTLAIYKSAELELTDRMAGHDTLHHLIYKDSWISGNTVKVDPYHAMCGEFSIWKLW
ncbi:hypothetical protein BS47DRAFT_1366194 [Hydnum rufescens UP504]|uniref:Uncharacterized protein n=1 Tax=Hydnum rufescens UP504 TaxID=1448309 RepID=A0A9P6DR56_9AGAM|nr:hypothetical protein BS47DRAFT_1366194 [Hydnum rufescens UP504]